MLSGSLVTIIWHVLRLQIEEMDHHMRMVIANILNEQSWRRGGPPAWLGVDLTTRHENTAFLRNDTQIPRVRLMLARAVA
jgi:hypothetical protein